MTGSAAAAIMAAAILAVTDWWAVATWRTGVERLAKPAVIGALLVAALTLQPRAPEPARGLVVLALSASLVGDVLLLPGRRAGERRPFVAGMVAFALAHVAYATSFLLRPLEPLALTVGLAAGLAGALLVGRPLLMGAGPALRVPVASYTAILLAMAVLATGTTVPAAIIGAWSFVVSDAILAWTRFVDADSGGQRGFRRVAVHVTYHAAQALIVLALLS